MPEATTLLYLHGVGDGDPDDQWRDTLESALKRLGYPDLSDIEVIAPKYPNGLHGVDDDEPLPSVRVRKLRGEAAKRRRREFERQQAAMEVRLGWEDRGHDLPLVDEIAPLVVGRIEQANNYVQQRAVRAWVLQRILRQLPESGRLVIVGHSLGSVVAADLIRRLPADLDVVGMLTIGSPLAHDMFHAEDLKESLTDPPPNLSWWVNVWNHRDPVSPKRGITTAIPWALDLRMNGTVPANPIKAHASVTYLKDETVASAIGFALFGSRSTDIELANQGVDLPLDEVETMALLALRYAHLEFDQIDDEDRKDRYRSALRSAQWDTIRWVATRRHGQGDPVPATFAKLAFDLSDPASNPPEPWLPGDLSKAEAVVPLLAVASTNVIRPFEIEVPDKQRQEAMKLLAFDMQLGTRYGTDVIEAIEGAQKVLKPKSWAKWAAFGIGGTALVVATGGLALAAAPGVAGAAALTSALAAFGPGGMIGGLLTAGTLTTIGGGGIAVGLADQGTAVETAEAWVSSHLAAAILRDRQGLKQDPETWKTLLESRANLSRELGRRSAISDDSSPGLKALEQKLEAVSRAIDYLKRESLNRAQLEIAASRSPDIAAKSNDETTEILVRNPRQP